MFEPKDKDYEVCTDDYLPLMPKTTAATLSNQSCIITPSRQMPNLFMQSPISNDNVKSYSTLDNEEYKVLENIQAA